MKKNTGFTLIELMIAVAIIGILAAVAFPAYQNSIVKGNRANAKSFLMEVSQRQSQYVLDQRAYADELTDMSLSVPTDVSKYYTVTIALSGPPPGYTLTATPKTGTKQAQDGVLTLDHTGAKTGKW